MTTFPSDRPTPQGQDGPERKSHSHRGELFALLTYLVKAQGYGQEKYFVFILQPQAHTVFGPVPRLR